MLEPAKLKEEDKKVGVKPLDPTLGALHARHNYDTCTTTSKPALDEPGLKGECEELTA